MGILSTMVEGTIRKALEQDVSHDFRAESRDETQT